MAFSATPSNSPDATNNGIESTPLLQQHTRPANVEAGRCFEPAAFLPNEFVDSDSVSTITIAKQEASLLIASSIPLALAYLLQYGFNFINMLSVGHLGADKLAAAALGTMTICMLIDAPATGLACALDTFCSTGFTGSDDKTLVGFHLQRGFIAVAVQFLLVLPILINIEPILIALNQDPAVSHLCGRFVYAQLFGLLPWMFFECIKRFLQAQGHMKASTYVLLAVLPLHLVSTYLFVWSPIGFGFLGAAVANVVTFWAMLIGIIIYSWHSSARAAWGGWTHRSFTTMLQYYRLAIPSATMIVSMWIAWELMTLATSYLGNTALAAQSIVISTCSMAYQPIGGLVVAVTNRTGNLLGQARARRSEISSATGLLLSAVLGSIIFALYILSASWWGRVYSNEPDVVATVAMIMPICGFFFLFDSTANVSGGVIRSLGRQAAGAWISIPSYYIIGLPFGLYLTYGPFEMGVHGIWIGLCTAIIATAAAQTLICMRANYTEEVKRCMAQVSQSETAANQL
ncbi:ethionine resistance protein [Coemansia sp. RSA 1358]|uniref:Ethionine resistance protein n=1 Tax=Coemansia umbellata TaxID=1424467 RepID=A0ABQ8PHH8_9FUNG|nr:ethionine resistance protein [Coemansia umbellata]KAJ2620399.1 ethionine resistance protein [Coemansia sp. RSA 1358]